MVSIRRRDGTLHVRVAREFLGLGERCVQPVVAFAAGRKEGRRAVNTLIRELPRPVPRRRAGVARPEGETHHLGELLEEESRRAFGEAATVPVTWGIRRRVRARQRSIRLGSYSPDKGLIRVNPLLDHPTVPQWFVGFVLYHELLHHRIPPVRVGGRRLVHNREFRQWERLHPRFEDAQRWEKEHLPTILRRGRVRGRGL
ncbi:MAG: hypothetical protein VYE15_03090, partial [Myxococcota bacterium]|nr:hypothetical protein [Myxococcota bacterium]